MGLVAWWKFENSLSSDEGNIASFSRASVAYKEDGTEVTTNIPRYEKGKIGYAVMVEEGTTNLHDDPLFTNVDANNVPTSWTKWIAYDNTVNPTVYEEGLKRFCRLEVNPDGTSLIQQNEVLTVGADYTVSYWARLNVADVSQISYLGFYYANNYYYPTGISFDADGSTTITITGGTLDYEKIKPSNQKYLYKLYDSANNFLGYVVDTDSVNGKVTLDRSVAAGSYTSVYFKHIDHRVYHVPTKDLISDNQWTYQKFTFSIPLHYNENGAYINTSICYRLHTNDGISGYLDIWQPQIEQKPYATSFTDGTRSPETLTIPTAGVIDRPEFTIGMWAKANVVKTDRWQGLFDGRWSPGMPVCLALQVNTNYLYFYYLDENGINTALNTGYVVSNRTAWHHYVITYAGGIIRIFVDGVEIKEATVSLQQNSGTQVFYIGRSKGSNEWWNGFIDDLRIYDYALSDKEIKELAKAKILHYKFDDFQEPTTNNIPSQDYFDVNGLKSAVYDPDTKEWTLVLAAGSSTNWRGILIKYSPDKVIEPAGAVITYSWEVYSEEEVPIVVDLNNYGMTTSTGSNDNRQWAEYHYGNTVPHQWVRMWATYQVNDDQDYYTRNNICFGNGFVPDHDVTIKVRNIQHELKDHPTSFVDGSREGIVHDCSGYEHHATLDADTPQWVEDSKLGGGCYYFNNKPLDGQHFQEIVAPNVYIPRQGTLSAWIKGTTDDQPLDNIYPFGWRNFCTLGPSGGTSDSRSGLIYYYNASSYTTRNWGGQGFYDGNWHLYTIAWDADNDILRLYKDGNKVGDDKSPGTMYHIETFRDFVVGSAWSSTYGGHGGYIDDVRVYATMLSDDDVKQLYQQRASLDDKGNLYTHEFKEPRSHLLIKEQTKNVFDNDWNSMGTWTIEDTDVSDFVESDRTLGNFYIEGWAYCSSADYTPRNMEYTKLNNDQGFRCFIENFLVWPDSWGQGWHYFQVPVTNGDNVTYYSVDQTPWHDMTRLEFYRTGPSTGVDTSQYITLKDVRLVKYLDNRIIKPSLSKNGIMYGLEFNEVGPTDGLMGWWKLDEPINQLDYSDFSSIGDWIDTGNSRVTPTIVDSPEATNGKAMQFAGGEGWYYKNVLIPYDPNKLYCVSGRVRQVVDDASSYCYIGVEGVASDGTTMININGANSHSSQHYIAASHQLLTVANGWVTFRGYFTGHSTSAGGQHNDPNSPAAMYDGVAYIRPLIILNYNDGVGTAEVDYIEVREIAYAKDVSRYINYGIVNGCITTTGINGLTYKFNGMDDYISIPDNSMYDFTNAFTMSLWIKRDASLPKTYNTTWRGVVTKGPLVSPYGIYWASGDGSSSVSSQFVFEVYDGTTRERVYFSLDTEWHHILALFNGSEQSVYVDGSLVGTNAVSAIITDNDPIYIGYGGSDRYFPGKIADVRLYNRALSPEEVRILYELTGGSSNKMKFTDNGIVYVKGQFKEVG